MAIIKVTFSLLKKQKAYAITIFLLTMVVSLMLASVLTILNKSGKLYDTASSNAHVPDFLIAHPAEDYDPGFPAHLEANGNVNYSRKSPVFYADRQTTILNDVNLRDDLLVSMYTPDIYQYQVQSSQGQDFILDAGEVMFPLFYQRIFSINEGDVILLNGHEFKVAGFFEDPLLGSPLVGTRRAYLCGQDFEKLHTESENPWILTSVYLHPDSGGKLEATINFYGRGFMFSSAELRQYSMMLSNLISIVLFSFALLSLVITLFILRYAVLSSIEGNFVTFGAFKAIGFTGGQMRQAVLLQYGFVCLAGAAIGVIGSIFAIPVIGSILMDSAGLLWNGSLWGLAGIAVIFAAVLLISGITWLNTRQIKKISPVRAISLGRAPVYFAKKLNVALKQLFWLPLTLRMAIKQMMTRRKQYTVLVAVVSLLSFMIIFMGNVSALLSNEKEITQIFGYPARDIGISLHNFDSDGQALEKLQAIIAEIEAEYQPLAVFEGAQVGVRIEASSVVALGYEYFDGIGLASPLAGRFPKYDNELALSPVMAKRLNKGVGDTVHVLDAEANPFPFLVTGIVQHIMDVGQNFSITTAGIRRVFPDFSPSFYSIILSSGMDKEAAAAKIKATYSSDEINVDTDTYDFLRQLIDSVQTAIEPATLISYVLTIVLAALVTFLLAIIAIYRENTDIGIFKSVGFTAKQLRRQFAVRFLLVSLTGGLMGALLIILAGNALASFIFGFFGVPDVRLAYDILNLLMSIFMVCVITMFAAWLVSGRIRKVSGRNLAVE